MIWVRVTSPLGVEAEFDLESVTLAVDLALRSERAGLRWRAEARYNGAACALSLDELRALAITSAPTALERQALDEIEWHHALQTDVALN